MRTTLKNIFDTLLHPLGLNVERYFGKNNHLIELQKLLQILKIDTTLDVGANIGQFAFDLMDAGFNKTIISFEPLQIAHTELKKNAEKYPNWQVFRPCAIGDKEEQITIHISENVHSSSILKVKKNHTKNAPSASIVSEEKVQVYTLDQLSNEVSGENLFLKIDTQGFEDRVLLGAKNLLKERIQIIQLELSFIPLYEGGKSYCEMLKLLQELDFSPVFFSPGYTNRENEVIQQVEGFFVKNNFLHLIPDY